MRQRASLCPVLPRLFAILQSYETMFILQTAVSFAGKTAIGEGDEDECGVLIGLFNA